MTVHVHVTISIYTYCTCTSAILIVEVTQLLLADMVENQIAHRALSDVMPHAGRSSRACQPYFSRARRNTGEGEGIQLPHSYYLSKH